MLLDRRLVLLDLGDRLPLLQFGDRLLQDLRVLQKIFADDLFEFAPLLRSDRLGERGGAAAEPP